MAALPSGADVSLVLILFCPISVSTGQQESKESEESRFGIPLTDLCSSGGEDVISVPELRGPVTVWPQLGSPSGQTETKASLELSKENVRKQLLRLRLKVPGCNVTRPFSNEKRFLRKVSSNSAFLFSQEQVFFL